MREPGVYIQMVLRKKGLKLAPTNDENANQGSDDDDMKRIDYREIDTLKNREDIGSYQVVKNGIIVADLMVIGDDGLHVITQVLFSNFVLNDDKTFTWNHNDGDFTILYRAFNISAENEFTGVGTWSAWDYFNDKKLAGVKDQVEELDDSMSDVLNKLFPIQISYLKINDQNNPLFEKGTTKDLNITWDYNNIDKNPLKEQLINSELVANNIRTKVLKGIKVTGSVALDATTTSGAKVTATTNYRFISKSYFGIVEANFEVTPESILNLNGMLLGTRVYTKDGISLNNQSIVYAYPKEFGELSSVKDGNGFEMISSYEKIELAINEENYLVYKLKSPATNSGLKQSYM